MSRFLSIEEQILINQFSQGLVSLDKMDDWFISFDRMNKKAVIHNLIIMVIQLHPTYEEMESAVKSLNKSKTSSAVKFLKRNQPFAKFGYELCDLPENELSNSFKILLVTLSIADNRRKSQENPDLCKHWWHKDLSDKKYLKQLKKKKSRFSIFLEKILSI